MNTHAKHTVYFSPLLLRSCSLFEWVQKDSLELESILDALVAVYAGGGASRGCSGGYWLTHSLTVRLTANSKSDNQAMQV